MKVKMRDFQEKLLEDLQNKELANAYLDVCLRDEDPRIFLLALKDVCDAQGMDMTSLAKKTKITKRGVKQNFPSLFTQNFPSFMSSIRGIIFLTILKNKFRSGSTFSVF